MMRTACCTMCCSIALLAIIPSSGCAGGRPATNPSQPGEHVPAPAPEPAPQPVVPPSTPDRKPEPEPATAPKPEPGARPDEHAKPDPEQTKRSADEVMKLLAGQWRLESLNGRDVGESVAGLAKPPSILFAADGGVSGFSGVNRFTGRLDMTKLGDGEFKLSPLAMTRMAGSPEAMQLEGEFATALAKAAGFRLQGDTLSLTLQDTDIVELVMIRP